MCYGRSSFRDFESNLIVVAGLDEFDIQLVLEQQNSIFVTYEISPRIDSNKDFSDDVYTMGDLEGTLQIK